MCAAIIAYIPFINCYQQKHACLGPQQGLTLLEDRAWAPAVRYDHTASSGGLWPLPGQR